MIRKTILTVFLLLVVLFGGIFLFHFVSVGGLLAFSHLKARHFSHVETPAPVPAGPVEDSGETYSVAAGDTAIGIAKKLHVQSQALLKLNGISDPRKLQIGQKLKVPSKKKTEVAMLHPAS